MTKNQSSFDVFIKRNWFFSSQFFKLKPWKELTLSSKTIFLSQLLPSLYLKKKKKYMKKILLLKLRMNISKIARKICKMFKNRKKEQKINNAFLFMNDFYSENDVFWNTRQVPTTLEKNKNKSKFSDKKCWASLNVFFLFWKKYRLRFWHFEATMEKK